MKNKNNGSSASDDIDKLIEDEKRKVQNNVFKTPPEKQYQGDASHKISKAIVKEVMNNGEPRIFSHDITILLLRLIKKTGLENLFAHDTFAFIEMGLRAELEKFEGDALHKAILEGSIRSLNVHAVGYFENYLAEQFKDIHIAEILTEVKNKLMQVNKDDERYFYSALIGREERTEKQIELLKEEELNKSQMSGPGDDKETVSLDKKIRGRELSGRQWLIALRFFVEHFRLRNSANVIDFGRLLAVLNNGKNLDDFRKTLYARNLITLETASDAQTVANLFRDIKLEDVALLIEKEIKNV